MTPTLLVRNSSFSDLCPVTAAVEALASTGGIEERGAIFTRREVVDFILDLTGYTTDQPLHHHTLLEPSFGDGDFLLPAIERLLIAWKSSGEVAQPLETLSNCIRAVELHRETFNRTRATVIACLNRAGIDLL